MTQRRGPHRSGALWEAWLPLLAGALLAAPGVAAQAAPPASAPPAPPAPQDELPAVSPAAAAAEAQRLIAAAEAAGAARCPAGSRPQRLRAGRGRLRQCLRRRDGAPHGAFERRDRRGRVVEAGAFRDGAREGPWLHRFSFSADLGTYSGDHKHGRWLTRLDDGPWHSLPYRNGKLHGEVRRYTAAGACTEVQRFHDGRPAGRWLGAWPAGQRRYVGDHDAAGRRHGVWRSWHEDGALAEEQTYIHGRRHGPYRSGWPEGAGAEEGAFVEDERDGLFRAFDVDGGLVFEARWRRGVLLEDAAADAAEEGGDRE